MSVIQLPVIQDHERFRAELASVAHDGRRKWIYARKPQGSYTRWRVIVSTLLLAFLALAPFVKVGGHQFLLLNLLKREFVFFGVPFWPNDFYLVVLLFLFGLVSIVVFTSTLGRLWCGWLCPQTVFMETVFRRIEWWIDGSAKEQALRDRGPWNADRVRRFVLKHAIFFAISFLIANLFLAYVISSDTLLHYVLEGPVAHLELFVALVVFTIVFFLVFSRFREQACLIACPYGRFMSALVDENTVAVTYDFKRGETRSKWRKNDARHSSESGHCIDCYQCVTVCPTGIDIRNGIQLECVNCTACIDACDEVMDKVGLRKGLIRYTSQAAVVSGRASWLTSRIKAYLTVWVLLAGLVVTLFMNRATLDVVVLRAPGTTWTVTADGIANFYQLQIINKSEKSLTYALRAVQPRDAVITPLGLPEVVRPGEIMKGRFMLMLPADEASKIRGNVTVDLISNGETIKRIDTKFLAP